MNAMYPIARFIATGAYSGLSPIAPGTAGSLVCVLLWFIPAFAGYRLTPQTQLYTAAAVFLVGTLATKHLLDSLEKRNASGAGLNDPGFIVIDEFAGMLIALAAVRDYSASQAALAFVLFRMFDIIKCWPMSWCERAPGALGVMLDDVAAGIVAYVILAVLVVQFFT